MKKITVHRYDSQNQPLGVDGWFDQDRAQEFVEHDPMTAERHADAIRRGQTARFGIDSLLRTEEGRWVLKMGFHIGERGKWVDDERDADRRMGYTTHRFVNDDDATGWLIDNGYAEVASKHGAQVERGPGRPEIGGLVQVRLGALLPSVDAVAARRECTRAEAVRHLVVAGLDSEMT